MNPTQQRILHLLRTHGSITPRSFRHPTIDGGGEMDRLAARIGELRDLGYRIDTAIEKTATGKRFARYTLAGEPEQPVVVSSVPPTHTPVLDTPATSPPERADGATVGGAPETPTLFDMPRRELDFDRDISPRNALTGDLEDEAA